MTVPLYIKLSEFFWIQGDPEAAFTNSWQWNLMCRSMNVMSLHANALGWTGDCLSVEFGVSKTKGEGAGTNPNSMMKHLFGNPFQPYVSLDTRASLRQHTPVYASIRQFTPALSLRQHTPVHASTYASLRQHLVNASTYASLRQFTPALSLRQHLRQAH